MKGLALALLAAVSAQPVDHPRTYLVSVVGISLKAGESIESFSFETWGVEFGAVCHIPSGWRIKAGSSATPDGVLEGEGSHGTTWLSDSSPPALRRLVLVTLYGPMRKQTLRSPGAEVPATFRGYAIIQGDNGETKTRLTTDNIRLVPATHC